MKEIFLIFVYLWPVGCGVDGAVIFEFLVNNILSRLKLEFINYDIDHTQLNLNKT